MVCPVTTPNHTLKSARLGLRIRKARVLAGFSQEAFAEKINTSRRHVMRLEKGQHRPSEPMLNRISEVTETSIEELLGGVEDEEESSTVSVTLNLPQVLFDEAVMRVLRQSGLVTA